ncbi:unnamed protein product [Ostreobium quekettii]|uniref:Protein kinase domain-containing protein n=1 Tax=Ostreobium quekettii TaxID=121088 RepID=A0A8S1ILZ5_9CHLO|nr:unnamed protein product [Ostreobium quekettii]
MQVSALHIFAHHVPCEVASVIHPCSVNRNTGLLVPHVCYVNVDIGFPSLSGMACVQECLPLKILTKGHMKSKAILCTGCVLYLALAMVQPAVSQADGVGGGQAMTVTTCPELLNALDNMSVDSVVVEGHIVCSVGEEVLVDRRVSVSGQRDQDAYDSIDFMGDSCMIRVTEKSSLDFSNLLLLENGPEAGLLCSEVLPSPTVAFRNVSFGMKSCEWLSDSSQQVCQLQEDVLYAENTELAGLDLGYSYDLDIAHCTFFCGVATAEEIIDQKTDLPVTCESRTRKPGTLNATVVGYVVGFVVPSLVVLVGVVAVLIKTGRHKLIWRKLDKFRGPAGGNSWNSFLELADAKGHAVGSSPGSATSATPVRLSLPQRRSDAVSSSSTSSHNSGSGIDLGSGGDGGSGSISASPKEPPLWHCVSVHEITLKEPMGKGQFSTVYRGEYKGTSVAVKMVEHEGRLLDCGKVPLEVQLTKDIAHPNIVSLLLDRTQKRSTHISGMFTSTGLVDTGMFGSGESMLGLTAVSNTTLGDAMSMTGMSQTAMSIGGLSIGGLSMTGLSQTTMGAQSVTPTMTAMSQTTLGDVFSEIEMRQQDERGRETGGEYAAYTTWIVMEYCDRGSLSNALYKHIFCPPGKDAKPNMAHILLTAMDVAAAMRYLHMKGIIHGDLKAQNCLLKTDRSDTRGFVCKVGDFGFSRKIGMNTHIETFTCGTVSHQPPELLRDGILTPAADVYSFGLLMWQMVMGKAPYANMNNQRILVSVVDGRRPPLPENCPLSYNLLMTDCWQENHRERPGFEQILDRLGDILSAWSPEDHKSTSESPEALAVDSGAESFRLPVPRPTGPWNYDMDRRGAVSPDGLIWNPTSPSKGKGIAATPVFPPSQGGPRPVQPMSPGSLLQRFDGYNPLYLSSSDVKMPDPNAETPTKSDCIVGSLKQPQALTKTTSEAMPVGAEQKGSKYGTFIFTTPRS